MSEIESSEPLPTEAGSAGNPARAGDRTCSWLPATGEAQPATPVDAFLESLGGRMRILGCRYEGAQLRSATPFRDGKLDAGGADWTCGLEVTRDQEDPAARDLVLTFNMARGEASAAGVALAFDFAGWSKENYILVPGMVYVGNRFRILPLGYPPYIHDEQDRPLDMPITTTNILHLNRDGRHAKIEMNTGNVATPMLSFFNPQKKRGFILLAEQRTRFGNNGLLIGEDAGPTVGEKRITFVVSAPGVREQRYISCGRAPSGDLAADWKAGDRLQMRFKVYNFQAEDLPAFYEKVFDVRKALTGLENPDIYMHTDDDTFLVMDHVEASVVNHNRQHGTKTVRIVNPTACDASVSIFAETSRQARNPLGWAACDRWPRVPVKAGETVTVIVGPSQTQTDASVKIMERHKHQDKGRI